MSWLSQPACPPVSRLLESLEEADARYRTERKLLVCRDRGEGRELLRALALRTGGWLGWEAATLRDLAGELSLVSLARRGIRVLDEIEQAAMVDAALDRTVELLGDASLFRPLAQGLGFRRALVGSVVALRLAGVGARELRSYAAERGGDPAPSPAVPRRRPRLIELGLVFDEYLLELDRRHAADLAAIFVEALESFESEFPFFGARIFLAPGLGLRGLTGRLVARLLEAGATALEADPVVGVDPPAGLLRSLSGPGPGGRGDAPRIVGVGNGRPGHQLELPMEGSLELPIEGSSGHASGGTGSTPRATCLSWLNAPERIPEDPEPIVIHFFRAANPGVEVREVLRRVIARGMPWDAVEIVATDPVTYGCALDVLASRLEIPVTYGVGLPLERGRVGRALGTYLRWLEGELPARPIWEALENGEILPPRVDGASPSGAGVARQLRWLRIGWSHGRYLAALDWIAQARAENREDLPRGGSGEDELETTEEQLARRERRERELRSLEHLLRELLESVPLALRSESYVAPGALDLAVSVASLACGALRFLELFRARGPAEEEALRRVQEILRRVAAVSTREAPLGSALAELRNHLAIRVPPAGTSGKLPWSSTGGALHMTDVAHGGRSGRPCTFVVGFDAERASARGVEDPVLGDQDRRALSFASRPGPGALPTSSELVEERRYALCMLLAGLRGEATLSYSGWQAADGSLLSPSPILLQALRVRERDPRLGFKNLEDVLGTPVSAVPADSLAADATDIWLGSLSEGALLLEGEELVRSGFPMLAAGIAARSAREGDVLTPFHGRLTGSTALDPRVPENDPISASALEKLAACPLSWLYRYGLKIRKPEDPERDPGRWLDHLQRGSLLHTVFERFARAYQGRQHELGDPAAVEALGGIVEEELRHFLRLVPPPSPAAYAAEAAEVHRSARVFLRLESDCREGVWEDFELDFGIEDEPVRIPLEDGRELRVRGRIDRIDRLPDRTLRVIDYKTGRPFRDEPSAEPPFKGGRRIQAGLYTRVVEILKGSRVSRFEYLFSTSRGEDQAFPYEREQLERAMPIVASLLDLIAQGLFLATDDPEDCRYCDYGDICRVSPSYDKIESPPAKWSSEHGEALEEYSILRRLREKP